MSGKADEGAQLLELRVLELKCPSLRGVELQPIVARMDELLASNETLVKKLDPMARLMVSTSASAATPECKNSCWQSC